mmetsp:Transcript_22180/g.51516  ORF Transcript_22180/g.51516 Transcript_22180/m.51516 type:complete len:306 (-) Transcript_22180:177-1094(-)
MQHWRLVVTTRWPYPTLKLMTRSRKSSSSSISPRMSCTITLLVSLSSTEMFCHSSLLSRTCPKTRLPFAPAPASCVQSLDQAMALTLPMGTCSREYVHPVRSHRRMLSYIPTANNSPFGDHAAAVMANSRGLLWNIRRPNPSHTLYLRSSPPDTISPLTGFQSTLSTVPSCAFHCSCLAWGCSGLTMISFPQVKAIWFESGDQESEYTEESTVARVDLSMPLRDQILTTPSSPAVPMAVPSLLHRSEMTAPLCASTFFSTRPLRRTSSKVPSEHDIANWSDCCRLLPEGNQCRSVGQESRSVTLP